MSRSGRLAVGSGHELFWESVGSEHGVPIVMLHGGPGVGCSERDRGLFDLQRTRAVLFDQRGAGRSIPSGATHDNTTADLVADIERLRVHLGIERWWVFGGSWGTTLALAYGEAHPQRCLGFVLRATWLYTMHEVDAMFGSVWSTWAPTARWHGELFRRTSAVSVPDMLRRAYTLIASSDPSVHGPLAQALLNHESALCDLPPLSVDEAIEPENMAMARIGLHYQVHQGFLREGELLDGLPRIRHLPAWIVHGQNDRVCPVATAQALHARWPGSRLHVVPGEGHVDSTPGMRSAVMAALASVVAGSP